MGLTLARCPACGANLNLEIDRDFFYCPHCGSKVLQQEDRIVIEHVNRTIDEAELRWAEIEERKRIDEKEKAAQNDVSLMRFGKTLVIMGAAGFLFSFFGGDPLFLSMRIFSVPIAALGAMCWAVSNKK